MTTNAHPHLSQKDTSPAEGQPETVSLAVWRTHFTTNATLGALYINGQFFCHTLEPRTRASGTPKIPGKKGNIACGLTLFRHVSPISAVILGHVHGVENSLFSAMCQALAGFSSMWATRPLTPQVASSWERPKHPSASSILWPPFAGS